MSIEASPLLDPFIKAKLQEHGIIATEDLQTLLGSLLTDKSTTQCSVSPSRERESWSKALRDAVPALTPAESRAVVEAFESSVMDTVDSAAPLKPSFRIFSLSEMRQKEQQCRKAGLTSRLTTFCRSLDELLMNGIQRRGVSEISGPPGTGKTQLVMQLAVTCTLPLLLGGLGGACIFLDTEGSFVPERFYQIAAAAVARVVKILPSVALGALSLSRKRSREPEGSAVYPDLSEYSVEYVLQRVHYCRIADVTMLLAVLHSLPDMLEEITGSSATDDHSVKLVVLDSIAMPFRSLQCFAESNTIGNANQRAAGRRSRLLFTAAQLLHTHAVAHNLAVVVTNHVVSRPIQRWCHSDSVPHPSRSGASLLVPALGDHWGYGLSVRVVLSYHHHHLSFDVTPTHRKSESQSLPCGHRERVQGVGKQQHRVARVVRGSPNGCREVCFAITRKGIRDWLPTTTPVEKQSA